MSKVNFKVRFRNPVFIAQFILAILTPILAYAGLTMQDLTSWGALGSILLGAIKNPYVLGLVVVSLWNCLNDPTTPGLIADGVYGSTYDFPGGSYSDYDFDTSDSTDEDLEDDEEIETEEIE